MKKIQFTQHFCLNKLYLQYIHIRTDKRTFLFFIMSFFAVYSEMFLKWSRTLTRITEHRLAALLKIQKLYGVFFFFISGCAVFLTVNTRPCARWKSSKTWIETSRARPNAGRSLWSVSVRKKRNSRRSGRIRRHSRDCAWWGPWGLTGWHTLSGEKWGRSFTSWSLWPARFHKRENVIHLNLWLLIDLTEHLHSSFCCSVFYCRYRLSHT